MHNLITIKTYGSRIEAEADKGLLENSNIKAIVLSDDCGGARPQMTFREVQLLIQKKDFDKASKVLKVTKNK